jgi:hypothetical protein
VRRELRQHAAQLGDQTALPRGVERALPSRGASTVGRQKLPERRRKALELGQVFLRARLQYVRRQPLEARPQGRFSTALRQRRLDPRQSALLLDALTAAFARTTLGGLAHAQAVGVLVG